MNKSFRNFVGLAAMTVLAACELAQMEQREPEVPEGRVDRFLETGEAPEPWMDITRQRMFVEVDGEPVNVNEVLSSQAKLERALEAQFPDVPKAGSLREYIESIEVVLGQKGLPVPELSGFGGLLTRAFLDAALMTLDAETGLFDPNIRVLLVVHGQILHYSYDEIDSSGRGSGEIKSITYVTKIVVPVGRNYDRGEITEETTATYWHVRIRGDGFIEYPREEGDENYPFGEETMRFSNEMVNYINFHEYEYKLWAEGNNIEIVEVKRRNPRDRSYTTLDPDSHPEEYYEGPENCIDILWKFEPRSTMRGLEPPSYCMGRCKSPGLVNTNAG